MIGHNVIGTINLYNATISMFYISFTLINAEDTDKWRNMCVSTLSVHIVYTSSGKC